jgi:hypothetical protein
MDIETISLTRHVFSDILTFGSTKGLMQFATAYFDRREPFSRRFGELPICCMPSRANIAPFVRISLDLLIAR